MEDLSNKTEQSCHIGILYNNQLMVVAQTKSPGPISLSIEEGSLFPLLKTTSGRVILASLKPEHQKNILENNSDFKLLTQEEQNLFLNRLEIIKERGYELQKSEITLGVTDIGVPVGKTANGIFSVLTISSLTSINKENEAGEYLIESVTEAAETIDKAMKL